MNFITHTMMPAFARIRAARASSHSLRGPRWTPERTRQARRFLWVLLVAAALYVLFTHLAWAAKAEIGGFSAEFELFDEIDTNTETTSQTWFSSILELVKPTFLALAVIEICWAAAIWAFEKDNLNSLAVEFIKKIMFIGFFYALLLHAPDWIPKITKTFQFVGEETTNPEHPITTDYIIAQGLVVIQLLWEHSPKDVFGILGKLGQIIVACFVTIGVIIAYVVAAAQYFTIKIESYILLAAGAIFLGLGSSSWTKEYVSKYLNYAINVGVRLLVLILIFSLTLSTVSKMGGVDPFDYGPLLKLLAIAILQALLSIKAPEMAGALLNGGIGLSAGSAAGAASSAFGSMKMAAGMAVGAAAKGGGLASGALRTAAGAGVSAAQGIGNMGKAVSAGREIAKQEGKSGVSATLSGLGKATGQAARDSGQRIANATRALPGKLMDAVKGKTEHGSNPGLFDRTKQNLQSRAAAGTAEKASGTAEKASGTAEKAVGAAEKAGGGSAAQSSMDGAKGAKGTTPNKPIGANRPSSLSKGATTGRQPPKPTENI